MSTLPSVSVIVCSYNHEKWISRCIRSILNQKYVKTNDLEIILIDDNSTDNTQKILETFKDIDNLKIIKNKKNMGLPKSLNKAIKLSKGRYLLRVDSDDYISNQFIFFIKNFLDYNRHYDAIACDYIKVDENEKIISYHNSINEEIACGIMFRREAIISIGLYDENFKMREGHDLRRRLIAKNKKLGRLELPFYKYRQHFKNRSNFKRIKKYDRKIKNTIYS